MTGAEKSGSTSRVEQIGRYTLLSELASGGMATVHLARQEGAAGFGRIVVVKRLHPQFAKSPDFVCMLLDEARLASRVRHPNVVPVTDVVAHEGELLLAMEYVDGLSLSHVRKSVGRGQVPLSIVSAVGAGLLTGLHAAHQAYGENGELLRIVHRDVSPQNVMLGVDGVVRVVDFGIASATERLQTTAEGQIKGKLSYMAPEQARTQAIDARADLFSSAVVLWELLTGKQFAGGTPEQRLHFILNEPFESPSVYRPEVGPELDAVIMRALSRDPQARFESAEEMTHALLLAQPAAHTVEVSQWLKKVAAPLLAHRRMMFAEAESEARSASGMRTSAESMPVARAVEATARVTGPVSGAQGRTQDAASSREAATLAPKRSNLALIGLLAGGVLVLSGSIFAWTVASGPGARAREDAARSADTSASPQSNLKSIRPKSDAARDEARHAEQAATQSEHSAVKTESAPASSAQPTPELAPQQVKPAARPKPTSRPAAPPQPLAAPPASSACSPPYELLKGGFKRYKPECL